MLTDARLNDMLDRLMHEIDAPPMPLEAILLQIERSLNVEPAKPLASHKRVAIGAMAAIVVIVALTSHRLVDAVQQTIDRDRAMLYAIGGWAPPNPPDAMRKNVLKQAWSLPDTTIAAAQKHVPFTIVSPVGLPRDVVSAKIRIAPTWIYSSKTRLTRVGPDMVWFIYHRADHRSFLLLADKYDPNGPPESKYIIEPVDSDGHSVLIKHDHFVWRNGDQVISAVTGPGLSASEIRSIEAAMHGTTIPEIWPDTPKPGAEYKGYALPDPSE